MGGMVDTGTRIRISLKITNHCQDKLDRAKAALLVKKAVQDLENITAVFYGDRRIISADFAKLEPSNKIDIHFHKDLRDEVLLKAALHDLPLASYSAIVRLADETTKVVEISARLRDRSIQIKEEDGEDESSDCAMEEGTAWGSTAIIVRTTTFTTTSTTATTTTETQTDTSTVTTTGTSTSSTRTTSTTSSVTTTTRPCACFEICCEDKPVQGVHLPVVPNVCPEWWQGKMTGRAWHANASGLPSNLENSLTTKKAQQPKVECVDCGSAADIELAAHSPTERVSFQKGSNHFFQKWSSSNSGSVSPSPRLEAVGVLALCALSLTLASAMLRRSSALPRMQSEEMADRDAGLMDQLVEEQEPIERCL